MYSDYHLHTEFSDDSEYPMESLVQDAIRMGLEEICFTDHVDYGVKAEFGSPTTRIYKGKPVTNVDYPRYFDTIKNLQLRYGDQIKIKAGLEFGVQIHTTEAFHKLVSTYPMDFILLSIHQVDDQEFWTQEFQKGKTQAEYNRAYYQALLDVVKHYKAYSVLGHLDLIVRYDELGVYPFENVKDMVREILEIVIHDGKGIEVNTSYNRYGLSDMTPSRAILKLYRELGGKIITIGSDTHKAEHLGAFITEAKEELLKLGFTHHYTFEKMKPIAHPIRIK
ncbi:MAG: histidinol-phosphatase HisJ family protein [Bacilli bacterium]|nr:histidinol-phosphatase HisJ family protein [Bacilli bacterium]